MIFVTGGTGLIGAHLLADLVQGEHLIRASRRPNSDLDRVKRLFAHLGRSPEQFDRIEWVEVDLLDTPRLYDLLEGVRDIYHCAAVVSFDSSDSNKMIRTNIDGTANLVNAALEQNVRKFCHVSSTAALGPAKKGVLVTETTKWKTNKRNSSYSISKHFAEREVWRGAEEGLSVVVVNPCVVIGPGNWDTSSAQLFQTLWKGMRFFPSGSNAFVDVRDVVDVMTRLMQEDISNERFLVTGENLSYEQLFNWIADALNVSRPSVAATNWMLAIAWRWEWLRYKITGVAAKITKENVQSAQSERGFSNTKVREQLQFEFRSIEGAVESTAAYFQKDFIQRQLN